MLRGESNQEIARGVFAVVIVGPKLLVGEKSPVRTLFSQASFNKKVLGLVVDEAHCIYQWGGDFRPEYSQLSTIRALLPNRVAVHATSVTMPPTVLAHMQKSLLIDPASSFTLNLGNDRPNIYWEVRRMPAGKPAIESLSVLIPDNPEDLERLPKGMVFFDDILESMKGRRWFLSKLPERFRGRVKTYNARRHELAKKLVLQDFREGTVDILFATEAAGMVSSS